MQSLICQNIDYASEVLYKNQRTTFCITALVTIILIGLGAYLCSTGRFKFDREDLDSLTDEKASMLMNSVYKAVGGLSLIGAAISFGIMLPCFAYPSSNYSDDRESIHIFKLFSFMFLTCVAMFFLLNYLNRKALDELQEHPDPEVYDYFQKQHPFVGEGASAFLLGHFVGYGAVFSIVVGIGHQEAKRRQRASS